MKLYKKLLLILILFTAFIIFNDSDCFGYNLYTEHSFTSEQVENMKNQCVSNMEDLNETYDYHFNGYTLLASTSSFGLVVYYNTDDVISFYATTNNANFGLEISPSSFPVRYAIGTSYFSGGNISSVNVSSTGYGNNYSYYYRTVNNNTSSTNYYLVYTDLNVYRIANPQVPVSSVSLCTNENFLYEATPQEPEVSKLDLFELNLTDLDDNNYCHTFNISTYEDSPYYDEISEYYNNDNPYLIYVTDYHRRVIYDQRGDNAQEQYSSYMLSGYVDFLTSDNAYVYYSTRLNRIMYSSGSFLSTFRDDTSITEMTKYVKRYYFKLVFSEDSNDPNFVAWSDNGNLFQDTMTVDPEHSRFIGSNYGILYAKEWGLFKLKMGQLFTQNFYSLGYLNFPFLPGEYKTRSRSNVYNFDYGGGTWEIYFENDASFSTDIENSNNNLQNIYNKDEIPIDGSDGNSYIQGRDWSTSTFNYGEVTNDTSSEDDEQYIGKISAYNDKDIHYDDFTDDNFSNISSEGIGVISNTTDTIKNKFSFGNSIIQNGNELKELVLNTQASGKIYVYVNHEYVQGNVCIIDMTWYEPYREAGDTLICAFVYGAFIWHIAMRLPEIVNGAGTITYTGFEFSDMIDSMYYHGKHAHTSHAKVNLWDRRNKK